MNTDLELVAVVAGIVAAVRKQWPKVDGVLVYLVAVVAAVAVCYVAAPGPIQGVLTRAARIVVGAVGGVSLGSYMLGKIGEAIPGAAAPAEAAPPAPAPTAQPADLIPKDGAP